MHLFSLRVGTRARWPLHVLGAQVQADRHSFMSCETHISSTSVFRGFLGGNEYLRGAAGEPSLYPSGPADAPPHPPVSVSGGQRWLGTVWGWCAPFAKAFCTPVTAAAVLSEVDGEEGETGAGLACSSQGWGGPPQHAPPYLRAASWRAGPFQTQLSGHVCRTACQRHTGDRARAPAMGSLPCVDAFTGPCADTGSRCE